MAKSIKKSKRVIMTSLFIVMLVFKRKNNYTWFIMNILMKYKKIMSRHLGDRHAFWSWFLLIVFLFFLPLFLRGKRKGEKNWSINSDWRNFDIIKENLSLKRYSKVFFYKYLLLFIIQFLLTTESKVTFFGRGGVLLLWRW